ncbi:MAG: hypothetical protein ABF785_12890 [Acetobacter papayae]|uniref:hypothetical protein n=1 Tax=Acetobacter papayae TaxID=1076592 RepID=UPI0039E82632
MLQTVKCSDIVRLGRNMAVCVGVRHDHAVLCFLVPESENTRHRADVSLSLCDSAEAGIRPDQRVRCVGRVHGTALQAEGRMPAAAMRRILSMLERENTFQASEHATSQPRGPRVSAQRRGIVAWHAQAEPPMRGGGLRVFRRTGQEWAEHERTGHGRAGGQPARQSAPQERARRQAGQSFTQRFNLPPGELPRDLPDQQTGQYPSQSCGRAQTSPECESLHA